LEKLSAVQSPPDGRDRLHSACCEPVQCLCLIRTRVVTQKNQFSNILEVVSRPEFAQDHESGLRSDRGPVVLCDFSKSRFWKSPYDFSNLYGRFCPYNPPYRPGGVLMLFKTTLHLGAKAEYRSYRPTGHLGSQQGAPKSGAPNPCTLGLNLP
jgi:hypothetical protein